MSTSKKIVFLQKIAIFMSIIWTIMTYVFFSYQLQNEQTHIYNNTIIEAKSTIKQAKDLMIWAYDKKIKYKDNSSIQTDFSLRSLVDIIGKDKNFSLKLETNYLEDDFDGLNASIVKSIKKVQNNKKDDYVSYIKDNREHLFYMMPLLANKSCIQCHIHDDKNIGDLIGNININILVPTLKEYNSHTYYFFLIAYGFTWIIGLILIWWSKFRSKKYLDEKTRYYEESIYSFIDMLEKRDSYTAGHSKRVANYALLIAKKLNLNEEDIDLVFKAGMLHDIGKISIPESILLKPDVLSDEEYEIIKNHSKAGAELLEREPFYDIASIVLHHHEHFDGSGYPYGLKGNEIPFLSQIIMIADVYDAVTTNRSYRKAMSKEEALKLIEDGRGVLFNPDIVDIAKSVFLDVEIDTC